MYYCTQSAHKSSKYTYLGCKAVFALKSKQDEEFDRRRIGNTSRAKDKVLRRFYDKNLAQFGSPKLKEFKMNIVLAGMPGSGKTTVAEVFKRRGKTVIDTDEQIVKEHGAITNIFERYGEEYFRNLETQVVKKASALENVVIATGGGCLLRKQNVGLFKNSGKIIYLKTDVETLVKRVGRDTGRPLLQGGAREKLYKLNGERSPIYEQAADFVIQTDNLSPEQVANKITEYIDGLKK